MPREKAILEVTWLKVVSLEDLTAALAEFEAAASSLEPQLSGQNRSG